MFIYFFELQLNIHAIKNPYIQHTFKTYKSKKLNHIFSKALKKKNNNNYIPSYLIIIIQRNIINFVIFLF